MTVILAYGNVHAEECTCHRCLMADMDAFLAAKGIDPNKYNVPMSVTQEKTFHRAPGTRTGNGTVRFISSAQVKYIKFLLNTRDITNLKLSTNQTIESDKIETMGLPAGKALIDKLQNCPEKAQTIPVTEQGSDKQKAFLRSLIDQTNAYGLITLTDSDINRMFKNISEAISNIKILRDTTQQEYNRQQKANPQTIKTQTPSNLVTEGMYRTNSGDIFKVQRSKESGNLYAKKLVKLDTPKTDKRGNVTTHVFEYAPGAMRNIKATDRMSIEDAAEFGKRTGTCCNCGRTLTNPDSIDAGIGPICAQKF